MKLGRVLVLLLLAGAAGAGGWWWYGPSRQEAAVEPQRTGGGGGRRGAGRRGTAGEDVTVSAAAARVRNVPVTRDGIGAVQAYAMVTVRAQIDGRLMEVAFREGQEVKAGEVLARIDPAPWQAALDQALAKLAQDEATLANARLDLDRYERLAATNAGPRQQADQQKAMVAQLQAQVRADQAAVDAARINLGYTTLTAAIDGRAGLRQIDAGNIIRAGDAAGLVTLAQIQPIAVLFTLPQRDLAVAQQAMRSDRVPVDALDTDGRTVLASGTLEVIDNQVDQATGTIRLKAAFPNKDRKLWPGQFVSVRVRVSELEGALVVPTPALRRGPQGVFVYRVGEDDTAQVRPVTIEQQDEEIAVVKSGLSAGDLVVTAGFQRLTDGKRVTVAPETGSEPAADGAPAARRGRERPARTSGQDPNQPVDPGRGAPRRGT
jgi:multidrug efflux system membrane fusion protein